MPIKIISGVLFPNLDELSVGSAKISFKDGKPLPGSGGQLKDVNIIGSGDFVGKPSVQVSLRHITVKESDKKGIFRGSPLSNETSFNLNHELVSEHDRYTGVSVSWFATPNDDRDDKCSQISEISLLIIGETK